MCRDHRRRREVVGSQPLRTDRRAKLQTTMEAAQADGTVARRPLDLTWVGEKWWPLLTGRTARDPAPTEVDRRHFEICLFGPVTS